MAGGRAPAVDQSPGLTLNIQFIIIAYIDITNALWGKLIKQTTIVGP